MGQEPVARASPAYWWDADPGQPVNLIVIRLSDQKVLAYQNGRLVGEGPVCTGKPGYETRPGRYRVLEKDRYHRSTLYGCFVDRAGHVVEYGVPAGSHPPPGLHYEPADMFYYMRIYDAVGMHAGWLVGYPASHGCIRLLEGFAQRLFDATPVGTPVLVVGSTPAEARGSLARQSRRVQSSQ